MSHGEEFGGLEGGGADRRTATHPYDPRPDRGHRRGDDWPCGGAGHAASGLGRARLRAFDYDPTVPLDIETGDTVRGEGFVRVDLSWASPAGGRVPAWLYLPVGTDRHPAILLQHGMPGTRDGLAVLARAYARAGAVVLAPTAPFGRPDAVYHEAAFVPAPHFDDRDVLELAQAVQDLRRGVDLLLAREDVDPERIAFVGHSYGGWAGAVLAGVEHRIRAFGLLAAPPTLAHGFRSPGGLVAAVWEEVPPERRQAWYDTMARVDGRHFVGRAAPARLRFDIGLDDDQVWPEDARALAAAASQPKTVALWTAGHALVPEALRAQAEWLAPILGLDVGRFGAPDLR